LSAIQKGGQAKMRLKPLISKIHPHSAPHFIRLTFQLVRQKIDTIISYLLSYWWGVGMGRNCTFVGLPKFRRAPTGSISVGERCRFLSKFDSNLHGLNRPCMISAKYDAQVVIGNDTGMSGTVIVAAKGVSIGSRVMCGANTIITDTDSHAINYRHRHPGHYGIDADGFTEPVSSAAVAIEDDVFIGMNVMVLKGVTIGRGTVVGAGSIVSKNLPERVIAVGQPAIPIAKIDSI
jgi:acetyltransferase-like isoleucine patch superfamily enzyme